MSSTRHDQARPVDELASLLRKSRRRVCWSFLANEGFRGLTWGATFVLVVAIGYLFVQAVGMLAALPALPGLTGMLLMGIAVIALTISVSLARGLGRLPTALSTAERLDLSARSHNRVATALWLADTQADTPFSRAAIDDGLAHLRQICRERPEPVAMDAGSCRVIGYQVVAAVVMLTVGAALPSFRERPGAHAVPVLAEAPPADAFSARTGRDPESDEAPPRPAAEPEVQPKADAGRSNRRAVEAEPSEAIDSDAARGRAGGGVTARAETSAASTGTQGGSSKAGSRSESEAKRKRPRPKRAASEARVSEDQGSPSDQGASATGQGQSSGGSMLAVRNTWSQRAHMSESEPDEEDSDEEIEEEREGNRQRGGVQPSLKDRNEAPGRELGISEGQGPPGSGRGGPTPPKKSRGVASLVLGVPIPDFVKGRLAPGTTKVTHERVQPTAMPGGPLASVAPRGRSMPEDVVGRYEAPAGLARVVRNYLIALHSSDRRASDAPDGSGAAEQTTYNQ